MPFLVYAPLGSQKSAGPPRRVGVDVATNLALAINVAVEPQKLSVLQGPRQRNLCAGVGEGEAEGVPPKQN